MTLEVSGDRSMVEKLVSQIEADHDGHVVYAFTPNTGRLALAMSATSDEAIENVPAKVVGTVRAAAHGVGYETPGWPEPVGMDHVRMKVLTIEDVRVKSLAA
jgi:hypothetical protein